MPKNSVDALLELPSPVPPPPRPLRPLLLANRPVAPLNADTPVEKMLRSESATATGAAMSIPLSGARAVVTSLVNDVIVTGDIFTTTQYPFIDLKNGGSLQGEIDGLNHILEKTIYKHQEEGGTLIIPGHGRVCDEFEVSEYRDMLVIIRDRVQAMINKGATLQQVKAAQLTYDYDDRFGATTGPWTTDMFVEAVYNSLKEGRPKAPVRK